MNRFITTPDEKNGKGATMVEDNASIRNRLNKNASVIHILFELAEDVDTSPGGELPTLFDLLEYAERIREAIEPTKAVS